MLTGFLFFTNLDCLVFFSERNGFILDFISNLPIGRFPGLLDLDLAFFFGPVAADKSLRDPNFINYF